MWKVESEVNKNVIPLWRGQGEDKYKTVAFFIEVDRYRHLLEETIVKDNLKENYLKKEINYFFEMLLSNSFSSIEKEFIILICENHVSSVIW